MIELLEKLVSYKTVNSNDELPFGSENKKCLNEMLRIAENDGFKVKNLDNYCGYIEIGKGDKIIGVVAHLDVVPANNEEDYKLKQVDNVLYGRGVSDDKGAVVAAYYALKELKDMELNKRVRLILGCNEETGCKCMEHYNEVEESLEYGFTPDGEFPCISAEKGIIKGNFKSINTTLEINGGLVSNAVSDYCKAKLNKEINSNLLDEYFKNNNLEYKLEDNTLEVFGKSAHASTPELGINAITHLICGLNYAGYDDEFVEFFTKTFGTDYNGTFIGINKEDEYSNTTLNIGVINTNDGVINGTIDIRFPVTMNYEQVMKSYNIPSNLGIVEIETHINPLFYSPESKLVKTLLDTYNETMNTDFKPLIIGGGTYAKEMNNTIAFGCAFPDVDYHIHDKGEFVRVEELELQKELYKKAILNLVSL